MYLVGGRIRGVHQEEIMSCIYDHNKCTDRMEIDNFLWETLPGASQTQIHLNLALVYTFLTGGWVGQ